MACRNGTAGMTKTPVAAVIIPVTAPTIGPSHGSYSMLAVRRTEATPMRASSRSAAPRSDVPYRTVAPVISPAPDHVPNKRRAHQSTTFSALFSQAMRACRARDFLISADYQAGLSSPYLKYRPAHCR
jgi:hypothetical protein